MRVPLEPKLSVNVIDVFFGALVRRRYRCYEYEIYRGQNEETFLSSTLAIQLQEEFGIPQSTIRDNFQKKCEKVGGLFKLKDAYK